MRLSLALVSLLAAVSRAQFRPFPRGAVPESVAETLAFQDVQIAPDVDFTFAHAPSPERRTQMVLPPALDDRAYLVFGLNERSLESHNRSVAGDILKAAKEIDSSARLLLPQPAAGPEILARRRRAHAVLDVRKRLQSGIIENIPVAQIEPLAELLSYAQSGAASASGQDLRAAVAFFDGAVENWELKGAALNLGQMLAAAGQLSGDPGPALDAAPLAIFQGLDPFLDALHAIEQDPRSFERRHDDAQTAALRGLAARAYFALQAARPGASLPLRNHLWSRPGFPVRLVAVREPELSRRLLAGWLLSLGAGVERMRDALRTSSHVQWSDQLFRWTVLGGLTTAESADLPPALLPGLEAGSQDEAAGEREAAHIWSLLGFPAISPEAFVHGFADLLALASRALKESGSPRAGSFAPVDRALRALSRYAGRDMPLDFKEELWLRGAAAIFTEALSLPIQPTMRRVVVEAAMDFLDATWASERRLSPDAQTALVHVHGMMRTAAAQAGLRLTK
ncbi:MAG: hypothetical protein HY552_00845 [Elusimicrobia bacterium]|nr:hypothetical protein [Elusimicrobiota bacterium]